MHANGQERTPSFFITSQNKFKCFGCSWGGDSIAFLMKLENICFVDAVRRLNNS
jgi:DNA primase